MIGLENQFSVFLRVAALHRFYCTVIGLVSFIYRGSYMSVDVLLNLLEEFGKREACRAVYLFLATKLINSIIRSMNVRFYLSCEIKIT